MTATEASSATGVDCRNGEMNPHRSWGVEGQRHICWDLTGEEEPWSFWSSQFWFNDEMLPWRGRELKVIQRASPKLMPSRFICSTSITAGQWTRSYCSARLDLTRSILSHELLDHTVLVPNWNGFSFQFNATRYAAKTERRLEFIQKRNTVSQIKTFVGHRISTLSKRPSRRGSDREAPWHQAQFALDVCKARRLLEVTKGGQRDNKIDGLWKLL